MLPSQGNKLYSLSLMSLIIKIYFYFILLTLFSPCFAQITEVNSMQEAKRYFENADCNTLALFDIDMVLIQPHDPAFQMANMNRYKSYVKSFMNSLSQDEKELFLTLMLLESDSILIETHTPLFLNQLSQQGIPTLALTANLTGQLGDIAYLEGWKSERLRKVGIDFRSSTPLKENLYFSELASFRENYPAYQDGILFTNGSLCSKGDLLIHFLQVAQLSPPRLIFIDDRLDNIKSVEKALIKYYPKTVYSGIHYLGANSYPSLIVSEKDFEARWEAVRAQVYEHTKK